MAARSERPAAGLWLLLLLLGCGLALADQSVEVFANGESTGGVQVQVPEAELTEASADRLAQFVYAAWTAKTESPSRALYPEQGFRLYSETAELVDDAWLQRARGSQPPGLPTLPKRLYWVPRDKLFVFPVVKVGHRVTIRDVYEHLPMPSAPVDMLGWIGEKAQNLLASTLGIGASRNAVHSPATEIVVESISEEPRVFFVENLFTEEEAQQLIRNVFDEETGLNKLERSTVGHRPKGSNKGTSDKEIRLSNVRTSENAFDTSSEVAMRIKKRAFRLLRVPDWDISMSDGLQVLRYQLGQAYIAHHDYFPVTSTKDFNWDPATGGANRFATVFLYLTDVEEGGQTVFNKASRALLDQTSLPQRPVDPELVQSLKGRMSELFGADSWQTTMVEQCYTQLSVFPKMGSAVVFYHQHANGTLDPLSLHGGCPVLSGQKFAANLWVWNGPRFGVPNPREVKAGDAAEVSLTFVNDLSHPVVIFHNANKFRELGPGESFSVNTFEGHLWRMETADGRQLRTWTVRKEPSQQTIHCSASVF